MSFISARSPELFSAKHLDTEKADNTAHTIPTTNVCPSPLPPILLAPGSCTALYRNLALRSVDGATLVGCGESWTRLLIGGG